jgi:hypothetical protein
MIRLISLAILVFYVAFCSISCGPGMPNENPKFRGAGQSTGVGTAPTDTPAEPAVEPPADTETPPPEDNGIVNPPTPPPGAEDPTKG